MEVLKAGKNSTLYYNIECGKRGGEGKGHQQRNVIKVQYILTISVASTRLLVEIYNIIFDLQVNLT